MTSVACYAIFYREDNRNFRASGNSEALHKIADAISEFYGFSKNTLFYNALMNFAVIANTGFIKKNPNYRDKTTSFLSIDNSMQMLTSIPIMDTAIANSNTIINAVKDVSRGLDTELYKLDFVAACIPFTTKL